MKYKRLFIFIILIVASLFLFACSDKVDPSEKETLGNTNIQHSQSNENNQIIQYADLNGNGIMDKIILTINDEYGYEYTLQVNDLKLELFGSNIEPNFNIVDIDERDSYKEIAVSEYGPSNDEAVSFFYYDGMNIIPMGVIEGFYGIAYHYGNDLVGNMKIDGLGSISTRTRGVILHTWFYADEYQLSEGHLLVNIPKDLYEMNYEVEVLREITLQKSREDSSAGVTLKKGEIATILASDNIEWCIVENSKGETGWFAVDDFHEIRGLGLFASDVFGGLSYAD